MKKYNYIYLKENKNAYFLKYIKKANIQNYFILPYQSKIFKIIKILELNRKKILKYWEKKLKSNFKTFSKRQKKRSESNPQTYWGNWKKDISNYNTIILGENHLSPKFTEHIKNCNPNCKTILFFWNCINENYEKLLNDSNIDEFWTFDKNDAKKYNINYNTQFYTKNLKLPKKRIIYDIIFVGRNKGRANIFEDLGLSFEKLNINYYFNVIKNEKECITYNRYLKIVAQSKTILDICSGKQIGLSLRVMESIFFEKKLITNNLDIINYNFYNPNNIFIIGKDNIKNLKKFIDSSYQKIDKNIVEYYDYHNWIKRF